jgi:hypothetical protein
VASVVDALLRALEAAPVAVGGPSGE